MTAAAPVLPVRRTLVEVTPAERLVLGEFLRDGATNATIATRLSLSPWTVASHLKRVLAQVGLTSRSQLAVACLTGGYLVRTVHRHTNQYGTAVVVRAEERSEDLV